MFTSHKFCFKNANDHTNASQRKHSRHNLDKKHATEYIRNVYLFIESFTVLSLHLYAYAMHIRIHAVNVQQTNLMLDVVHRRGKK